MKAIHFFILLIPGLAVLPAYGQKTINNLHQAPVETTVCKIIGDPSAYNNKLVKVRGYVLANFEYSVLLDECSPDNGIWFAFADGSGPPQLEIMLRGSGTPGGRDSKGRRIPPIPVRLIKDSSFEELLHYWAISVKGKACADGPPPAFPPDCTTYCVTATFVGRIDGVSRKIHAAHLRRSSRDPVGKGFGNMGMFDAQIVVQSVENVVAVDESEIGKPPSKPQ